MRPPYNLPQWNERAVNVASWLNTADLNGYLALMAQPPQPPADLPAWEWMRLVQIAAALVIAHIGEGQQPWAESFRRRALRSLIYGPMDWSGAAAILAVGELATRDAAVEADVEAMLLDVLRHRPDEGAWALEAPLFFTLMRLPHLSEQGRTLVDAYRQSLESQEN
jgi:hypothetical protein